VGLHTQARSSVISRSGSRNTAFAREGLGKRCMFRPKIGFCIDLQITKEGLRKNGKLIDSILSHLRGVPVQAMHS